MCYIRLRGERGKFMINVSMLISSGTTAFTVTYESKIKSLLAHGEIKRVTIWRQTDR